MNAQPSQFVIIRFVAEVANIYYGRLLRSRLCTERSVGEDTGSEPKALGDLPGVTWSVAPRVWPTLGACRLGLPEQTRAVRCGDRLPDGSVCCKEMLGLGRRPGGPGCTPSVRPSVPTGLRPREPWVPPGSNAMGVFRLGSHSCSACPSVSVQEQMGFLGAPHLSAPLPGPSPHLT